MRIRMEENQNLDSLSQIDNSVHTQSSSKPAIASADHMQRPKLRKIKRPKVRPMQDVPQPPEKIVVPEAPNEDVSLSNQDEVSTISPQNSLVTSKDAQNILNQKTSDSYVLEGLPPELDYDTDANEFDYPESTGNSVVKLFSIGALCLVIGISLGFVFFSSKKVEQHGLEGIVLNPDVPKGRARCGLTEQTQACVFYVMNCYKQELTGRNFYKLAAQLTGREEHMIETENIRYSLVKIRPGHFAQLNIPALK